MDLSKKLNFKSEPSKNNDKNNKNNNAKYLCFYLILVAFKGCAATLQSNLTTFPTEKVNKYEIFNDVR